MVVAEVQLLHTLYLPTARVVQKGNVGEKYIYALQMYKENTYISRILNNESALHFSSPQSILKGSASGHTDLGICYR